jgi:hypothetical protein
MKNTMPANKAIPTLNNHTKRKDAPNRMKKKRLSESDKNHSEIVWFPQGHVAKIAG